MNMKSVNINYIVKIANVKFYLYILVYIKK
jgi:hypothetical protein